jgi:predicted alpha/beta hydrolase
MERLEIKAPDGVGIPLTWYPAETPGQVLLMLPALGVESRLYDRLAARLAELGCSVCLAEQRGQGRSALRPSRQVTISCWDCLDLDIPSCLDWLEEKAPGLPLLLGGHSLGGHLSTLYSGIEPERISGVVHIACTFPFYRDYPPVKSWQIRLLCLFVLLFRVFPGYFPGAIIGFAGRESSLMMMQWRHWALSGNYDFDPQRPLSQAVKAYKGPVISIALEDDNYTSDAGIQRALSLFSAEQVSQVKLGPDEQGEFLGHFRWAKQPDGVANALADWMNRTVRGES